MHTRITLKPAEGRERYVFFAFPHIAIDESGELGAIARPNRPGKSCACGAMAKCLGDLQKEGLDCNCKEPGVHDPLEPELTILKQRLARRIAAEGLDPATMNLADITHAAERVITDDLEFLISKAVDPEKADYAVITGVQIHNWSKDQTAGANIEFVAPAKAYVVNRGETTIIDLAQVPALTPRQLNSLSGFDEGLEAGFSTPVNGEPSTLQCMSSEYLTKVICSSGLRSERKFQLQHKPLASYIKYEIPAQDSEPILGDGGAVAEVVTAEVAGEDAALEQNVVA
ncbi:low-CO2-inducible protein [Monoraphidium neglectum]|uniref:Low-CO2-inducible protein n=1 Tax=Monoraphidium neglectum TaxID=145388 RepID=A0A0D2J2P6_9CHLO|nr:low-CO2-inducible protein [Monoraphidium neglectum]KIY94237.1 low-CO2-inducible protein [Monoraphidium neglectum]|eukprot:XP_013893257.1 low-CO2-inducible protein [Monoraphidium neglectum]